MATAIGSFDLASLKNLRDDVTQYFWFESNSSSAWGSGAHVTLYPESQFTDSTSPNYMKGQNIIMNTDGFSIRNGALPMMVLDNDSLDFNAVDTSSGTCTTMATFGLSGMQIYSRNSNNNLVQLANLGYGQGYNKSGQLVDAPYYTLGTRRSALIGNYSLAEGENTTAAGYASHAEGIETYAIATATHTEGWDARAYGLASHTEGMYCTSEGKCSHAQNWGTIAHGLAQTVLGKFNLEEVVADEELQGIYALIIGNGSGSGSLRSNALTVDWDGHVVATSAKKSIMYTGEYIRLYGSEDPGTTAGRITITTSSNYVNCLPTNKYSVGKSPLADDLFSESAGVVTIKKAGQYRIEGQVYLYNGFTVNDQITCCILLNNGTNAYRATRTRLYTTNPFTGVPVSTVLSVSANATLSLGATNQQGARGTVGLSGYTRMTVECLGVYE